MKPIICVSAISFRHSGARLWPRIPDGRSAQAHASAEAPRGFSSSTFSSLPSVAPVLSTGTADLPIRMSTGGLSKRSAETVRNHRKCCPRWTGICIRDRIRTPMGELTRLSSGRPTRHPRVPTSVPAQKKINSLNDRTVCSKCSYPKHRRAFKEMKLLPAHRSSYPMWPNIQSGLRGVAFPAWGKR